VEGLIKETEVRRLTVDALVDTSAWTLVINEETRAKLGLHVLRTSTSEVANGVVETSSVTEGVNVHWQDRPLPRPLGDRGRGEKAVGYGQRGSAVT
jgi:hypothetical protein